jgi:hypothetical protein
MSKRSYFEPQFEESPEAKVAVYRGKYLKRNEIKTRQCVYISREIHNKISKIVNILATERGISIGGYIDTVLTQHLKEHRDTINTLYKKQHNNLI